MSDTTSAFLPSTSSVKMMGFLGKQGPCTFFKSIKTGDKTYSLSQFMPVKIWPDSAMLNIANVQLLWSDKTESFCSLKLYFLPENTPEGRLQQHGEDELIALQDTVTIRAADLSSILVEGSEWDWGFQTPSMVASAPLSTVLSRSFVSEKLDDDKLNGTTSMSGSNSIVVLSYPRYMRLRTTLKRLEGSPEIQRWLENPLVLALGALNVGPNCRVLYAKESFDHPDLEDNEVLCNHLAPKLSAKKRRMARKRNASRGSLSNESFSSSCSFGSYKENEQKGLNGVSKIEFDENARQLKESGGGKRRGSSSQYASNGCNKGEKLWIKSEPGFGSKKTNKRSNGMSSAVKMGDNGDWDNKAQLLGPALTELAQKLERSNALQILPIRPAASSDSHENHLLRKRRKIDYPTTPTIANNIRTGPYDSKSLALGHPGDFNNIQGDLANFDSSALVEAHTLPLQISKLSRVDINWKPLTLTGTSPCPFAPLDTVFCDPNDAKKHAGLVQKGGAEAKRSLDVMDFSQQQQQQQPKSRQDKGGSRSSSSKNFKNRDLTDSRSSSASSMKTPIVIDDTLASSTMNTNNNNQQQMGGVRLTSEVTLFPSSKYLPSYPSSLDGVMQHNFANPRHSANAALSNSKTSHEIDIQPWNPLSSSSGAAAGSSRGASSTVVSVKKHTRGANDRTSQSQSQQQNKSSSINKAIIGSSTDQQQKELSSAAAAMSVQQNPFMHPYFGKMDPAYLHFLANATPLFMPPPPPNFMTIPGAVEQFYKDFFMQAQGQGLPPGFPSFPGQGGGNDSRGSKS